MSNANDAVRRLISASVVIGGLPELPGYNGSVLTIDDEEAARCVEEIDAGVAEIERLTKEVERMRLGHDRYETARCMNPRQWADAWKLNVKTGKPFDEIIDTVRAVMEAKGS